MLYDFTAEWDRFWAAAERVDGTQSWRTAAQRPDPGAVDELEERLLCDYYAELVREVDFDLHTLSQSSLVDDLVFNEVKKLTAKVLQLVALSVPALAAVARLLFPDRWLRCNRASVTAYAPGVTPVRLDPAAWARKVRLSDLKPLKEPSAAQVEELGVFATAVATLGIDVQRFDLDAECSRFRDAWDDERVQATLDDAMASWCAATHQAPWQRGTPVWKMSFNDSWGEALCDIEGERYNRVNGYALYRRTMRAQGLPLCMDEYTFHERAWDASALSDFASRQFPQPGTPLELYLINGKNFIIEPLMQAARILFPDADDIACAPDDNGNDRVEVATGDKVVILDLDWWCEHRSWPAQMREAIAAAQEPPYV